MIILCLVTVCVGVVFGEVSGNSRDSYLDAYVESHGTSSPSPASKNDREFTEPFPQYPQPQYGPPSNPQPQYGPPNNAQPQYGPPNNNQPQYGPPNNPQVQYGPPNNPQAQYGPPNKYFAPSAPNYGPPPAPIYGAPPIILQQPIYGSPHNMLGFDLWDKFKFKLDLFTLGKILLKLVLFKKFISFVAILCLLLFIPHLKHKVDDVMPTEEEDLDNGRDFKGHANFILNSIENLAKKYEKPSEKPKSD